MESVLNALIYLGLFGFALGLYGQYQARRKGNIKRNTLYARLTTWMLVLFLAALILTRMISA